MRNFQDNFGTSERPFISAIYFCITVPLSVNFHGNEISKLQNFFETQPQGFGKRHVCVMKITCKMFLTKS